MIFFKNRLMRTCSAGKLTDSNSCYDREAIKSGDLVTVRSKKEIRGILDCHEKYDGCLFIDEMYEHCDKTYKVLKNVDYFFDEAKQKFCGCKDLVILDGVVCSGRQRLYKETCDRSCFFFWHTAWLVCLTRRSTGSRTRGKAHSRSQKFRMATVWVKTTL